MMNDAGKTSRELEPLIWILLGEKPGDNAHVLSIANALSLPFKTVVLPSRKSKKALKFIFRPAIAHCVNPLENLDKTTQWPEIILTTGRNLAMAALWFQRKANYKPKVVLIGWPHIGFSFRSESYWASQLSLIIYSGVERLPDSANVLATRLPQIGSVDAPGDTIKKDDLSALAILLVGGPTSQFVMPVSTIASVLNESVKLLTTESLHIVTSRRTPDDVLGYLRNHLPEKSLLHEWGASDKTNMYTDLLNDADRIVVTGDSISMLMDAATRAKPMSIAVLPYRNTLARLQDWVNLEHNIREKPIPVFVLNQIFSIAKKLGLLRTAQYTVHLHQQLVDLDVAKLLPDGFSQGGIFPPSEMSSVSAGIKHLLTVE
jgi:mitochondrial fission protein ELM1